MPRGASPEVPVPYSARWSRRAVRCCRRPDDPAAAFRSAPPATPLDLGHVEGAFGVGAGGGAGLRPCGFPPAPGSAVAIVRPVGRSGKPNVRSVRFRRRPGRRHSPAVFPDRRLTGAARAGHAPPLRYGRCSATRRGPSRDLAGACASPGGARGVRPFAVLLPPAGVGASVAPRTHLPFPRLPAPTTARHLSASRGMCVGSPAASPSCAGDGSPVTRATSRGMPSGATAAGVFRRPRAHRPRLLGFVPAGGPCPAAPRRRMNVPHRFPWCGRFRRGAARPIPPWAFASPRYS